MVKRILRVTSIVLLLSLFLSYPICAIENNDYTSPYYSDTSELEEVQIIDYLYEQGLMDGLMSPRKNRLGIFGPYDVITYQEFYITMNLLFDIKLSTTVAGIIPHELAITIFNRYQYINNSKIFCSKLPKQDKQPLTRLELACWVYDIQYAKEFIGENIAQFAKQYIGYNYKWGGTSSKGFDCSGFTMYIYAQYGYNIGRTCNEQSNKGKYITLQNLQPGDIVLFERTYSAFGYTHVGIYLGNYLFIHASNPRQGVTINSLLENYYRIRFVCGRRIIT